MRLLDEEETSQGQNVFFADGKGDIMIKRQTTMKMSFKDS